MDFQNFITYVIKKARKKEKIRGVNYVLLYDEFQGMGHNGLSQKIINFLSEIKTHRALQKIDEKLLDQFDDYIRTLESWISYNHRRPWEGLSTIISYSLRDDFYRYLRRIQDFAKKIKPLLH